MEISTETIDGVLIIVPVGRRIDATVSVAFKRCLTELVEAGNHRIAIDLSGIDFIDSSGLGSLAAARKKLGKAGEIGLFGIQGNVQAMFRLTRMDKVFKLLETREQAISELSI